MPVCTINGSRSERAVLGAVFAFALLHTFLLSHTVILPFVTTYSYYPEALYQLAVLIQWNCLMYCTCSKVSVDIHMALIS